MPYDHIMGDLKLLRALEYAHEPAARTPLGVINGTLGTFECQYLRGYSSWEDNAFVIAKFTFAVALGLRVLLYVTPKWGESHTHDKQREDAEWRLKHVSGVVEHATLFWISCVLMYKFDLTHALVFGNYEPKHILSTLDRYFVAILAFVVLFSSTRGIGKEFGIPAARSDSVAMLLYLIAVFLPYVGHRE